MRRTIRKATARDADDIRRIIENAYADWATRLPDLPDVAAGIEDEIDAGRMHILESGGAIVGVLNTARHENALHVMNIAVDTKHGGKGIAKALLAYAETLAKGAGATCLALATHKDMAGNVSMYEHLGWRVTGTEGNKVLMQRKLGSE